MKQILITGGAGNIGSELAKKLLETDRYFVTIVDDLSTGSRGKLPCSNNKNWNFIFGDVNEFNLISQVMISNRFDYVFHYAAVVGVKRTQEKPISVLNDVQGIRNILELSKNTHVKRIFFASSSEVYGEPILLPLHEETTPLNSRIPYAIVKNIGESFCKSYKKSFDLDYTIFRFFNTYGSHQSMDFIIPKFLKLALDNEDITIYGDGQQTRTFCYIDDNIDTCIKTLEDNICVNETLNVGSDIEFTVLQVAELIIERTKSSSKVVHLPALKEGDMRRRRPDNRKMKSILLRDLLTLEQGIDKILKNLIFLKSIGHDSII